MTRPRARPKPGRYWVVVSDAGELCAIADTRYGAEPWVQAGDRIVECVPMPRVRVVETYDEIGQWFTVTVNGAAIEGLGTTFKEDATKAARDLRRALRGK